MSKRWYMTVGYPGGEYAVLADSSTKVRSAIAKHNDMTVEQLNEELEPMLHNIVTRYCPPDLVEWLEAEMHQTYPVGALGNRTKVPGGWRYQSGHAGQNDWTSDFVPIAGAAGITVLKATE